MYIRGADLFENLDTLFRQDNFAIDLATDTNLQNFLMPFGQKFFSAVIRFGIGIDSENRVIL
ncbi:1000_t:CDS:2 [Ambispora gerdemannii]|uniref:1000_t:CDS:1 n=1 Tax=Ambispora gerdemannii TaxID=144530 RepID=A0A9N9FDQ9_9GLOM|nr:1000_t:CDS:2 [Ambispora gerdemannii]